MDWIWVQRYRFLVENSVNKVDGLTSLFTSAFLFLHSHTNSDQFKALKMAENQYTEDNIRSLDWKEHIRLRPGMYIGKLGDGSSSDDGIYILIKEVIDNSIDEFVMGNGKTIEVSIRDKKVSIRDYGRGIPLGKVIDCVSKINTGAKYDSKAFIR